MREYIVSLERAGERIYVGRITGADHESAVFQYDEKYLADKEAAPISLSLPLRKEEFSPQRTRNYFDGLLPEGFIRRTVAQWMHFDEKDYLSILHRLGQECLGAVRISEKEEEPEASYQEISAEQVKALAEEGATKSVELVTKAHLSLTGASGKVGLYYDPQGEKWYLPHGTAPSTHIVKQSHVRLNAIVTNEQLALTAAKICGIPIPSSFIITAGGREDGDVLFATDRYDRYFPEKSRRTIGGLPVPLRLHQEDFAQAMGIAAEDKYEKPGEDYLRRMFEILRRYSSDPIADQLVLWDMLVFHCLIGNTDAHLKNFSLLYDASMRTVRLAPAYDIISTTIYESSTREMAFAIGGVRTIDEVTRETFREAAKQVGLGERMAMRRYDRICGQFEKALLESRDALLAKGFDQAEDLTDRILRTGGCRRLNS